MNKKRSRSAILKLTAFVTFAVVLLAGIYLSRLSNEIRLKFDGKRWSLPAVVYARPLELFVGKQLSAEMVEDELLLAGYTSGKNNLQAGSYRRSGDEIRLVSRTFSFPSGPEPSQRLAVSFAADSIRAILDTETSANLPFVRLDPARIGSFHPVVHEDRIVVKKKDIPELLIRTLLEVEDRNFYKHLGISPLAIGRAMMVNILAGKAVQGGSTLTQQLVKNLFLTRERSLSRKIKEATMALLLEFYYDKDEILTAYINEVFLGQDGNRAIHGFALASQYYFQRQLKDLTADQIAILVGMVKGPSLYDPRRNPANCLKRRGVVLQQMARAKIIDQATTARASSRPIAGITAKKGGFNRFPAFLDLVRQQLAHDYKEEDLKTGGLQILTTLDPQVQYQVEQNLQKSITALELRTNNKNLQGAVIVTNRDNGEILALAGGKRPLEHGFNRAIQARRPIGSLIKPAIYLAALQQGFTLDSPLSDTAVSLGQKPDKVWQPKNFDHREHGRVPLYLALANSFNLATVNLGLDIGLSEVIATIGDLGYPKKIPPYPSLLLGAVSMSPLEVSQIYQTIASGGFYTSLRAINSVMASDHSLLSRYGLAVEQRFEPRIIYLLSHALQRVVKEGTGKALLRTPLADYAVAGKTGTSDGLRDSWFAGFTGNHLAVVWLGRDDNLPISLTGSSGALRTWAKIMAKIHPSPLELIAPPGISWRKSRFKAMATGNNHSHFTNNRLLPFVSDTTN